MNGLPMLDAVGWVKRVRSRPITTTKSTSASTRTRSAYGWRVAVGSGRRTASTTVGESATASATATARSVAASRASLRASTAASVRETRTSTTTTSPWSSRICRATDSSRTHRGTRTAAFLPLE